MSAKRGSCCCTCYLEKLGFSVIIVLMEKTISVIRQSDSANSGYVQGSMSERIAMVWTLTCEAVSLGKKYDAEQRLQRHITRLIKQKN